MLRTRLPSHLLPPRAVLLARNVVLVTLPEGAHPLSGNQPPFGTVSIRTNSGPLKVAALRSDAAGRGEELTDILIADPALTDPVAPILLGQDVTQLVDGVAEPSRQRLLTFLLGFCRKAFDLSNDPDFIANCLRLARDCVNDAGVVEPVASVAGTWLVVNGLDGLDGTSAYQLARGRVRRIQILPLSGPRRYVADHLEVDDVVLSLGKRPARWTTVAPRQPLQDILRRTGGKHQLREEVIATLVEASTEFRARLRESALLSPAKPIRHDDPNRPLGAGLDAVLADGHGALFLRGWLRDPSDLLVSAEIVGPTGARPIDPAAWHRFRRPDLEKHFASSPFRGGEPKLGFVALIEDPCSQLPHQPTLRLSLQSGASVTVRAPMQQLDPATARAFILRAVPPAEVTDTMFTECLSQAAAAFHHKLLSDRQRPDCIPIGDQVANPSVSVIIPLYRNLSFLRFQIAAFARDPDCRVTEIIYVLDSPEQRAEAEHMLRGLYALHGVASRLVVMRRNLGYAAANNAGAVHARAGNLLLLNSDVIPATTGWLRRMLSALDQPEIGAVGPKLLFDDGSIQHAGLLFQRGPDDLWLNAHFYKGMPSAWPAANRPRLVPGVTGAALLLTSRRFEQIGGVCEDYIIGDYEDSDLCLRLRALGLEIAYLPGAELFHFERKSISHHSGYQGTLACRHNRHLHHQRWNETIEPLMARFTTSEQLVDAA